MKAKKTKEVVLKLVHTIPENIEFVKLMIESTRVHEINEEDKEDIINHLTDIVQCLEVVNSCSEHIPEPPRGGVPIPIMVNNKIKS